MDLPRPLPAAPDRLPRRTIPGSDGVDLAVVDEGSGPAVLLLHGWPDSADLWTAQVEALGAVGRRVIAPDLRGFGASTAPDDVAAYRIGYSVRDVVALLDALDLDRVDVVGHDWGAPVAWLFATRHPARTGRLAALSVGHPSAFGAPAADGGLPLQHLRHQWYALLFQFAEVSERWLADDDWHRLRTLTGAGPDVDRRIADLSRPGALTATLNWYRANSPLRSMVDGPPALPALTDDIDVLGVWSDGDPFLVEEQMRASGDHVAGSWRYERLTGAGHWMQRDAPEVVNRLLIEHLTP